MIDKAKQSIVNFSDSALKYLVPFFYASITVAFYLKTYDSAQIKITLLQIVGTIIIALWLLKLIHENVNPFKDNITITAPILIYLGLAYFSFAHSSFPGTTLDELIRRTVYQFLALIIIREYADSGKIRSLINWVMIAAFISSFYGVVQYFDYVLFPKSDVMMHSEALDPFIWRQAFDSRIFSTHGNPNFFGNFLVIVSPIVLAHFLWKRSANYLILFLMIVFCIYKTMSKGAYLGFAAGLFIFTILAVSYFPIGKIKIVKRAFTVLTVLVVMASLFFVIKISSERVSSLSFRVFTWLSTWEMIETEPVIGTGLGTFKTTYPAYRRPAIFHIEGKSNTETDHPENEFLEVLYDDGIIGFGLFMWVLAVFAVMGMKGLKRFTSSAVLKKNSSGESVYVLDEPRAYYMLGLLSAFFGMLFHNLFDVSLRFVSSGIFLWMIIGLIGSLVYNNPLPERSPAGALTTGQGMIIPDRLKWIKWVLTFMVLAAAGYFLKVFTGYFYADIYHNQGIFHSKRQEWKQALEYYGKVVSLNPNFLMAHYFTGNVYNDRWIEGDWERALKKYDDVKKLAPNYVQVHHQTGNVYTKLGDKALNEARAHKSAGDDVKALAAQQKSTEFYELAMKSYRKYWKLDPVFPPNFYRMAWIYIQAGNNAKAEEMYRAALEHNPDYAETHLNLGNICYMQEKYADAEIAYKRALELQPNLVQALKNLSVVYDRTGRKAEARDLWNEIRRISPNDEDLKKVFK